MKQVSMILVAFMLCAVGQASLYITVDGEIPTGPIEVAYGDTLTIGFGSTDGVLPPDPVLDANYHLVYLIAFRQDWGAPPAWGTLSDMILLPAAGASVTGYNFDPPSDAMSFIKWETANPTDVTAGLWCEMTYTAVDGPGTYVAGNAEDFATPLDLPQGLVVINHIPEPATLSLFGLAGAIVLRRRRA